MVKDNLDREMRVFETAIDPIVLPDVWPIVRLDGRSFHQFCARPDLGFERPFDERFRDAMVATAGHLMDCGFRAVFAQTHSDEISLLLHREDATLGRRMRKVLSVLAGEASACFSLALGELAVFDARVSQLPTEDLVVRYFRWRQADAHRNALNGHCFWLLRRQGQSIGQATARLRGATVADQNEMLFQHGINFNDLPAWQRRGIGIYWQVYAKNGVDPRTGEAKQAQRRRLCTDMDLPMGDAYASFIRQQLGSADVNSYL
jgi:tRNA(His) guanylyltransferase